MPKAIQSLGSSGIADSNNPQALQDLLRRHPQAIIPDTEDTIPPTLCVNTNLVMVALKSFRKDTSPGASHLRPQHLRDAVCGNSTPSSESCLSELTKFMNLLLSGKAHPLFAPWLCGAPLTALVKPNNAGFRPIAVGETFRQLVSKLCCLSVREKPRFVDALWSSGSWNKKWPRVSDTYQQMDDAAI